MSANKVHY